jgi:uncharacterized damage-inducible protein DinB
MSLAPTPLPTSKAFGDDERSVLLGYLTYHRAVLARKLDGVSDSDGRAALLPPSTMTLVGLVRHMSDVERWWFRRVAQAEDLPPLFDDEVEWDMSDLPTVADTMAVYWAEIAEVDRFLVDADLDGVSLGSTHSGQHALRRTIVHLIEEYARHCGHADLLRERVDGVTGD